MNERIKELAEQATSYIDPNGASNKKLIMNKTLEALIRGYVLFRVNDEYFLSYTNAQRYRTTITKGLIKFEGYHILKGWQGFFYRIVNPAMVPFCYPSD